MLYICVFFFPTLKRAGGDALSLLPLIFVEICNFGEVEVGQRQKGDDAQCPRGVVHF